MDDLTEGERRPDASIVDAESHYDGADVRHGKAHVEQ